MSRYSGSCNFATSSGSCPSGMNTKNKIALQTLIDNINHTFYYIGGKNDDVDQFEIDQLHKLVDEFASTVTISDSQGE